MSKHSKELVLECTMLQTRVSGSDSFDRKELGGKGLNLVRLQALGFNVPPFVIVSSSALRKSMPNQWSLIWSDLDADTRREVLEELEPSDELIKEIELALAAIGVSNELLAVRSSSPEEDHGKYSFAGQLESYCGVRQSELKSSIAKVWRSAFTDSLVQYRELNGLEGAPADPAVIIQQLINADTAGVAFGADPLTGDERTYIIAAVEGLADRLVAGETDCATYTLTSKGQIVSDKPELGQLSIDEVKQIAVVIESTREQFGKPQDLEWAIQDNRLYILQARPITTLAKSPMDESRDASKTNRVRLDIWDNSNIAESYPGVTTPLTFSFARKAYEHVYREFSKLMGLRSRDIEALSDTYPQMLGLVNGRIYYNMLSWYRLLSLFPMFASNSKFMEQMMGAKEELPEEIAQTLSQSRSIKEKLNAAASSICAWIGILVAYIRLEAQIAEFYNRVEHSLQNVPKDLQALELDELAALYRQLELNLLKKWNAPITNDFFAMIFYGLLKKLSENWISKEGIHNELLSGESGIISTEPARRQWELARGLSTDQELLHLLKTREITNIESQLSEYPDFRREISDYLDKFGDRCVGELKLESETVSDNPNHLLKGIANLAENSSFIEQPGFQSARLREIAEMQVEQSLRRTPIKKLIFNFVTSQARRTIKNRENLRFERTRVFGAVRRIFLAAGRHLEQRGELKSFRDIFYLETEEVLQYIEGTATVKQLDKLAALRKEEFANFSSLEPAPDRFTTHGGLNLDSTLKLDQKRRSTRRTAKQNSEMKGIACCKGVVRGRARLVLDPSKSSPLKDEILIAERTDPGWISVIAQAKAIVVEYGSLLSHTAIVARELGIPTIVSLKGALEEIKTGDLIEVDGGSGKLRILEKGPDQSDIVSPTSNGTDKEVA